MPGVDSFDRPVFLAWVSALLAPVWFIHAVTDTAAPALSGHNRLVATMPAAETGSSVHVEIEKFLYRHTASSITQVVSGVASVQAEDRIFAAWSGSAPVRSTEALAVNIQPARRIWANRLWSPPRAV
jgi:hypothetical protein